PVEPSDRHLPIAARPEYGVEIHNRLRRQARHRGAPDVFDARDQVAQRRRQGRAQRLEEREPPGVVVGDDDHGPILRRRWSRCIRRGPPWIFASFTCMSVQKAQPLISEARTLTRSRRLSSSPLSLIVWPSSKSLWVNCGDCFVGFSLWLMGCPPFAQMTCGGGRTGQKK